MIARGEILSDLVDPAAGAPGLMPKISMAPANRRLSATRSPKLTALPAIFYDGKGEFRRVHAAFAMPCAPTAISPGLQ